MANQDKKKPNILVLFTDQQRYDTIGALGNPVIRTPALDRICREGTAFTSAYSPCPVCVPARCSMHYGMYPATSGCYENGNAMPMDGRQSFMDVLTDTGYRTHGIGKCHFTPDPLALRGFQTRETQEEMVGSIDRDDYMKFLHGEGFGHVCDPHGVRGEMYYIPQPSQMPARLHPTQWIGDRSVKFLEEQQNSDQPWMLYSSYVHPHPPFVPPCPWHKLYRAPMMPLPRQPQDCEHSLTWINRFQNRYKYRDQGIDQNLLRNQKAYYYGAISFVDYQVGRILDTLEKTGQLENTMIVFCADHGEYLGDYNCFGKRGYHDSCMRVPMLVRHPGRFEAGKICERPASLVDVMPTVLGAAGAQPTTHEYDGVDLADLASGANDRDMVMVHYQQGGKAIYSAVTEHWKYVFSAGDQREYFYDRVTDPQELRNRDGMCFLSGEMAEVRSRLMDTLRAQGADEAFDGDGWKQYPIVNLPENPDANLLVQDHPWADLSIPGYTDC